MPKFTTFRRLNTPEEANDFLEKLQVQNIKAIIENDSPPLDSLWVGNEELHQSFLLKIQQKDFERAEEVLNLEVAELTEKINDDYYLFEFSNDELTDILYKYDEWSPFDYQLAHKILEKRGEAISPVMLTSLKKDRNNDLAKPESISFTWLAMGYVTALFGGLFGMALGWYLNKMKKVLPDGSKVFTYQSKVRTHGKYMFLLGLAITLAIWIYYVKTVLHY